MHVLDSQPQGFTQTWPIRRLAATIPGTAPVSCLALRNEDQTNGAGLTLAHEIVHWGTNSLDCNIPPWGHDDPKTCELANQYETYAPPTSYECGTMQTWAKAQFGKWWDICYTHPEDCVRPGPVISPVH